MIPDLTVSFERKGAGNVGESALEKTGNKNFESP